METLRRGNAERIHHKADSFIWYLKNFNIFDNFSNSELEALEGTLRIERYEKGEEILLPSENHRRVFFLLSGKVKLLRNYSEGKELILTILNERELFGLLAPLVKGYSNPLVVALEKCLVASLNEESFLELMEQESVFCQKINQYVGERVLRTENRVDELVFQDIPKRLARVLLRFSKEFPRKLKCGISIDLKLTQEEIANLIGAARESTNFALNRFKRKGWIETHDRYICLHNKKALREFVQKQ